MIWNRCWNLSIFLIYPRISFQIMISCDIVIFGSLYGNNKNFSWKYWLDLKILKFLMRRLRRNILWWLYLLHFNIKWCTSSWTLQCGQFGDCGIVSFLGILFYWSVGIYSILYDLSLIESSFLFGVYWNFQYTAIYRFLWWI